MFYSCFSACVKRRRPPIGRAICTMRRRETKITKTKSSRLAKLANHQENRHG